MNQTNRTSSVPSPMQRNKRVLLIDHSDTALAIISKLITKHLEGTEVDIASRFQQAQELLGTQTYDLITLSRNMPDIMYAEMVDTIRNRLHIRQTPIIVISGEGIGAFADEKSCQYINGFFDKQLGQQKLVAYIRSYLVENPEITRVSGNILYVEDSPTVATAVQNILSRHGYSYLLAQNAVKALQHIHTAFIEERPAFDLLLTDIHLDGYMSGQDLIREIRHGLGISHEALPILVTTSTNQEVSPQATDMIIGAGANDIIEKPIREAVLVARLNNLLTLKQQDRLLNRSH